MISIRFRQTVMVSLICVFGLSGCAGHYKFSDHEYRPLGEPHVVNRGT
ncbi:type VI secretion protein [Pseudomonas sp. DWP3-1-2]